MKSTEKLTSKTLNTYRQSLIVNFNELLHADSNWQHKFRLYVYYVYADGGRGATAEIA